MKGLLANILVREHLLFVFAFAFNYTSNVILGSRFIIFWWDFRYVSRLLLADQVANVKAGPHFLFKVTSSLEFVLAECLVSL